MQERLSVGNVKLLNPGGGLPHVHYFPTKGDESSLIKDENDPAKKSYMRNEVCSKTFLLVLSVLLVALIFSLIFVSIRLLPRQKDDAIVEISVPERLKINNGDIKYQSIAHNFKLKENAVTGFPTEEELSDSMTNVVNEKQGDSRVPTEDDAEEVATEIHSATRRLEALMNEWSKESNLNWNSSEGEFDLMKQPPTDSEETAMAFLVFLIEAIKEAHGSIKAQADEFIPEEVFLSDQGEVIHAVEESYDSYEMGDYDDYEQDSSADRFSEATKKILRSIFTRENK